MDGESVIQSTGITTKYVDGQPVEFTDKVVLTFKKTVDGVTVDGLYPSDSNRTVVILFKTEFDLDWLNVDTEDTNYYTHRNRANLLANDSELQDEDSVNLDTKEPSILKQLDGEKNNVYAADNTEMKSWMYKIYLYGISDDVFDSNGNLYISDSFDSDYLAY